MAPALLQAATLALRALATVCPASPTCPQDDKCSYVSNGDTFQVNCATDFLGGDLGLVQAPTLAACMDACATTDGCVAVSYVDQNCYLKSTLEAGVPNDNVIGAYVLSSGAPASSSGIVSSPVPIQSSVVASSSIAASSSAAAPSSVLITSAASTSSSVSASATGSAPVSTACPASYTCPQNNGCTIQGADSRTFVLACGTDVYGSDFTSMETQNLQACNQACVDNTQCIAAAFTGGSGAGQCYLKNGNYGATANANVDAIYLDNSAAPTPSATSAASSSSLVPLSSSTPSMSSVLVSSSQIASASSKLAASSSTLATTSVANTPAVSSVASPSFPTPTKTSIIVSSSQAASASSKTPTTIISSTPNTPVASSPSSSAVVVSSSISQPSSTLSTVISVTPKPSPSTSPVLSSTPIPASTPKTTTTSISKPTPTPAPTQVVKNPSFEVGTSLTADFWTFTGTALSSSKTGRTLGNARTGAYSFQAQGQSLIIPWTLRLTQTISVVPGKAYNIQLWAKQTIPGNCVIQLSFNNAPLLLSTSAPLFFYTGSSGTITPLMTTASGGSGSLSLSAICATGASQLWIDDITATVV